MNKLCENKGIRENLLIERSQACIWAEMELWRGVLFDTQ